MSRVTRSFALLPRAAREVEDLAARFRSAGVRLTEARDALTGRAAR